MANPGDSWDTKNNTFQWYKNSAVIPDAVKSSYKLSASDYLAQIYVAVSGTYSGSPLTRNSSPITVSAGSLILKPVPTITGSATVGSELTAIAGTWDAGVTLAYQWFRNSTAIDDATESTYTLDTVDFAKSITVKVTGSATGYNSETTTSAAVTVSAGSLTSKPVPTVTGSNTVGSVLTADAGTWDDGVTLAYQWYRDGSVITSATSTTYTLVPADLAKPITVKVTGSATGYSSAIRTSSAVTVAAGSLTLKPVPSVTGSTIVGSVLTANAGSWDAGVTLAYQWLRDGVAIPTATSSTYTLVGSDSGKPITVKVTGTKTGYESSTTSSPVTVAAGTLTLKSVPTVTGAATVGSTLTAVPGSWDAGVNLAYQWFRDGVAITNATSSTYTLVPADLAKPITVKVTGSANGYTSETKTSAPASVAVGSLTLKPVPTVTGSTTVGSVLTANAGTWDAGVTLAYQWFRDGTAIPTAITSTYTLVPADLAKPITVKVTGSSTAYTSEVTTSVAVTVEAGVLSLKPVPTVTGAATVGSTLTAVPGSWDAGVTLAYQWFRDGVAITNATTSSYTLVLADSGKPITVKVTGSATAYTSATTTSSSVLVGALTLKPVPTVTGSVTVGSVLTTVTGSWDAGVTFAYQWYRDGIAIPSATTSTYTIVSLDLAKPITVKVTGSATGYTSETTTSAAVTVAVGALTLKPVPTVTGSATLNSVLTAVPDSWDAGVTFAYQWYRDGIAIPSATASTFTMTSAQVGHVMSLAVTGSKPGYSSATVSSVAIMPSVIANTPCSGSVDRSDWLTRTGAQPTISGVANVGLILTAKTGSWDAGTNFCTYWYSNGQAIKGAYSKTYKVQASDLNQNLQFIVIGTDKSGNSVLRYSEFLPVTYANFKTPPAPKLIG